MDHGATREAQMVRSLERFLALSREERAWRFRLAHRRAGLPEPAIPYTEELPERWLIPWKFKQAS